MATTTASATSMNFVGFENMKGTGTAEILYNRVYIMPSLPVTAGRYIHATAGFVPGQQSYLKTPGQRWNKSTYPIIRQAP